MGVPSYYAVHDVEEFCGITHDGPKLNRNYKDAKGNVIEPFEPKKNPLKIPRLLKMKKQVKKFGELLETKYKGYDLNGHRGVAEGRYEGYAVTPGREKVEGYNQNLKDLALPFKEFCEMNGVELVQDIWIGPYTSFGYGYFDEIPAAYVLKYLDFQTTMNFVKVNLWTWEQGTQYIWEQLNEHIAHPARLNSEITSVERRDGKVYVTVNGEVEEYDKIIPGEPPRDLLLCLRQHGAREARPSDGLLPPLEGEHRPGHHHLRPAHPQAHEGDPLRRVQQDGAGGSQDHAQPRQGGHQQVVGVLLPPCLLRGLRRRLV